MDPQGQSLGKFLIQRKSEGRVLSSCMKLFKNKQKRLLGKIIWEIQCTYVIDTYYKMCDDSFIVIKYTYCYFLWLHALLVIYTISGAFSRLTVRTMVEAKQELKRFLHFSWLASTQRTQPG